tara:strand:- start:806 stop:925 length:120 start_codon:yes stop_codon:yes gene_type:complete
MKIREEYKNTLIFLAIALGLVGLLILVIFLSFYANTFFI